MVITVGIVMTVGYYRLPDWAYCGNGLEHQNTAPELRAESSVQSSVHVSPGASFGRGLAKLHGVDAELATLLGPPQRLVEACKIDISHNVGNRVITVGIVIMIPLCAVLMLQTVITIPTVITLLPTLYFSFIALTLYIFISSFFAF